MLRALGRGAPSSGPRCSELKASLLRAPTQGARSAASLAADEGAAETEVATILASGLRQNTDRVLTLDSKDLDLQAGKRYGFVIEKTVAVADGKTASVRSNEAYATATA